MKADPSAKRAAAFAKRLLQSALLGPPAYACGALLLLSEALRAQPALWAGVQQPEDHAVSAPAGAVAKAGNGAAGAKSGKAGGQFWDEGDEDDGAEVFRDVELSSDEDEEEKEEGEGAKAGKEKPEQQDGGVRAASGAGASTSGRTWPRPGYYDPAKR